MIDIERVSKSYEEFHLKDISLSIRKGEFVTLLGASGSGKSTLLKILLGLLPPDSGRIVLEGKPVENDRSPIDIGISMVFQQPLLLPHMNVEENIAFGLKMLKIPSKERSLRVKQALAEVQLEGFEKRRPYELSGGQMQRVSLARALVIRPKILLMDEPFSALDQNLRIEMQKLLKDIQKQHQSTIVFVTHDRDEAFFMSDRIALIQEGRLIQYDSPQNIYNSPVNTYVANFLGIQNIFRGCREKNAFVHSDFSVPLPAAERRSFCALAIKPMALTVALSDMIILPGYEGYLQGSIKNIALRHGFYELDVEVGKARFQIIQNKIPEGLSEGAQVNLYYHTEDFILLA